MEAGLYTFVWITDKWVGLAHAPQIYGFSLVRGVLSVFKGQCNVRSALVPARSSTVDPKRRCSTLDP